MFEDKWEGKNNDCDQTALCAICAISEIQSFSVTVCLYVNSGIFLTTFSQVLHFFTNSRYIYFTQESPFDTTLYFLYSTTCISYTWQLWFLGSTKSNRAALICLSPVSSGRLSRASPPSSFDTELMTVKETWMKDVFKSWCIQLSVL